jgi:hypothetical protein
VIVLWLFGAQMVSAQFEACNLVITDGVRNETLKKAIEKNVSGFLTACNTAIVKGKKPDLDKNATTDDARKRFLSIWNTSSLNCNVSTLERKCITRPAGGYQIRDIPVTMYDAPEGEQNQEIVINLTADGKIDDVFIPITQYADLLSTHLETEDIDLRIMVLSFVENFRTAYNRKDLKFIETVFSNDAVIITGKAIKPLPNSDKALRASISTAQFEYQVKTKREYIASLKNVFKNNKYINAEFDDILVVRHPNPNFPVYGVTLKQVWNSTNYSDTGYVFLLIDFEDQSRPIITVRTWQPEKYDGRDLRRDEIFQMGDFIK